MNQFQHPKLFGARLASPSERASTPRYVAPEQPEVTRRRDLESARSLRRAGEPARRELIGALVRDTVRGRTGKALLSVRPRTDEEVVYGTAVGSRHPGHVAIEAAHGVLGQYNLPPYDVYYQSVRSARGAGGRPGDAWRRGEQVDDAVVHIGVRFRTQGDILEGLTIPFPLRSGRILPPAAMEYRGQAMVIGKSSFEEILERGASTSRLPDRAHVFSPPFMRRDMAVPMPEVPVVRPGLFGGGRRHSW